MELLKRVLAMSFICVNEECRYAIGGVLVRRLDGIASVVATDRRLVISCCWPSPGADFSRIVPQGVAKRLEEVTSPLNISEENKGIELTYRNEFGTETRLTCDQVEGQFPPWETVIPKYTILDNAGGVNVDEPARKNTAVRIWLDSGALCDLFNVLDAMDVRRPDNADTSAVLDVPLCRKRPIVLTVKGEDGQTVTATLMPINESRATRKL
jgi:hypothetical protein